MDYAAFKVLEIDSAKCIQIRGYKYLLVGLSNRQCLVFTLYNDTTTFTTRLQKSFEAGSMFSLSNLSANAAVLICESQSFILTTSVKPNHLDRLLVKQFTAINSICMLNEGTCLVSRLK